jgi:CubicO group peptidase (beta-lactamase class C family)
MKTFAKSFFFLLLLVPVLVSAQTEDAIHKFLVEKFPDNEPGAAVLVVKDGKTVLRKAYGLADVESGTKLRPETVFRIGSITKQFTSSAILKLSDQGKLNLQDEITKYLPDYPTQGKKITIEHLLTHTSGIRSYTSLPEIMNKETKAKAFGVSELISTFKDQPMDFNPGDAYAYNNSGYFLLGAIVEKVSGMSWGSYIQKNFFTPLKMKSTFTEDKNIAGLATGYVKPLGYAVADYVHPSIPYSAGAIFSTVDDLWKWNNAVFSGQVVKRESLEKAWTPLTLNSGEKQSYGYGWQLGRIEKNKVISHGGGIDGFLSYALYVPDTKLFVTVLCNAMSQAPEQIAYRVAKIALNVDDTEPAPIVLEDKVLEEYTGVYKINEKENRVISREGNQLYSLRTGSTKYAIYPYAKDAFYFKDSPYRLQFTRAANGEVEQYEMKGNEFVNQIGKRSSKEIPKERQAIRLDNEVFDQYVGQYELAPGFIITIKRDGEKYLSQATGQQVFEIFAESETKFFLKTVPAQLEFTKDEQGKVNGATLYQGGRTMPAKKISSEIPKERVPISLDPKVYDRYTGEYELAPGFVITIRRENDKLMAQLTGQPAAELFPESETKYFYKIVDAQIEFFGNAAGATTELKLYQGGKTMPAKKIR